MHRIVMSKTGIGVAGFAAGVICAGGVAFAGVHHHGAARASGGPVGSVTSGDNTGRVGDPLPQAHPGDETLVLSKIDSLRAGHYLVQYAADAQNFGGDHDTGDVQCAIDSGLREWGNSGAHLDAASAHGTLAGVREITLHSAANVTLQCAATGSDQLGLTEVNFVATHVAS